MGTLIYYPETPDFRRAIKDARRYACSLSSTSHQQLPVMNFVGTVKLHGSNTAIGYQKEFGHWCQSRNRVITPNHDHAGFAQHIYPIVDEFLLKYILPHCRIISEYYRNDDQIILCGEWCGGDIQKNVALCGLSTMFVIFKVKIINRLRKTKSNIDMNTSSEELQKKLSRIYWLDPKEWRDVKWHERSIYSIFDFSTYSIEIDFNMPELSQTSLTQITEQVEQRCPVGAYFNRTGIGEGVVWTEWTRTSGNLTFKVKGREHLVTRSNTLVSLKVTKVADIPEFIEYTCTKNRMDQALNYMREQNVPIEMKTLNIFVRWLIEDICNEEKDTMEASNLNLKEVIRAITKRGEIWYIEKVTESRKGHNRRRRTGDK